MVRAEAPGWEHARRVLCVRLDQIGDLLMTGPAVRALRETVPGRHITVLTSPSAAEAATLMPEVDEVLVYEAPWMKATAAGSDPSRDLGTIRRLRDGGYDAAAIFTVYTQSALPAAHLCYLAGIPRRLAHVRENPYQLVTDWVPESEPEVRVRHEVRRQLDLVATVGARTADQRLRIDVPAEADERAAALLEDLPAQRRWAVIHPGASAPSRRYPWESFAEVAGSLAHEHGWHLVFTGSADEADLVDRVRTRSGAGGVSLAGMLDLATLVAVLRRAPLLVAGNTGPVHVAAAVGTPVVDLYALTNPQHTPWGVPSAVLSHDVPCRNCYRSVCPMGHHDCLRLVEPQTVVQAAVDLHARTAPRRLGAALG